MPVALPLNNNLVSQVRELQVVQALARPEVHKEVLGEQLAAVQADKAEGRAGAKVVASNLKSLREGVVYLSSYIQVILACFRSMKNS